MSSLCAESIKLRVYSNGTGPRKKRKRLPERICFSQQVRMGHFSQGATSFAMNNGMLVPQRRGQPGQRFVDRQLGIEKTHRPWMPCFIRA